MGDESTQLLLCFGAGAICVAIIAHGLRPENLAASLPAVFVTTSFLILNVIGSFSPNITAIAAVRHYVMLALAACVILAAYITGRLFFPATSKGLLAKSAEASANERAVVRTFIRLATIVPLAAVAAAWVAIGKPLLFEVGLLGNSELLYSRRTEVVFGSGIFHWLGIGLYELPLFLVLLSTYISALPKLSPVHASTRRTVLLFCFATVLGLAYLHKTPLVYLITAVGLGVMSGRGRLRLKWFAVAVGVSVAVIAALYAAFEGWLLGPHGIGIFLIIFWHRIFEAYAWAGALAVTLIPEHMPFLDGRSLTNFGGMFPFEYFDMSLFVFPYIYGLPSGAGAAGRAPVPGLAEAYANFGWAGFVGGLVVLYFALVFVAIIGRRPSAIWRAMSLYVAIKLALVWQVALWFGALEPTVLLSIGVILGLWSFAHWLTPVVRIRRNSRGRHGERV